MKKALILTVIIACVLLFFGSLVPSHNIYLHREESML